MEQVFIVEDNRVIALDLKEAVEQLGFRVSGLADTGEIALRAVERDPPDVVLMDIGLGGTLDGITTARSIRGAFSIPVVFLTAHGDDATLDRVADVHADGFLVKPFRVADLSAALRLALRKGAREQSLSHASARARASAPPSPALSTPWLSSSSSSPSSSSPPRTPAVRGLDLLSAREGEVLALFRQGFAVCTMAERLGISTHTVRNHLKGVFRKVGVSSQQELRELFAREGGE